MTFRPTSPTTSRSRPARTRSIRGASTSSSCPRTTSYYGDDQATVDKIVMVPKADSDTEIASLVSGESDFIFPQAYAGITDALNDPNIKSTPGYGTNYEGLYFQQASTARPTRAVRAPSRTPTSVTPSPSRSTAT